MGISVSADTERSKAYPLRFRLPATGNIGPSVPVGTERDHWVPLNRVYTVLTQARTGPPRRSESNESMEHIVASGACLIVNLSAGVASGSARFSLSVVGPVTLLSSPGGPSRQARIF